MDPPAILDPIVTILKDYYQQPVTKPPIENDADKKGKPSDHLVVIMPPVSEDIICPTREKRIVKYRPLPQSGINMMGRWLQKQTWEEIYGCLDAHEMAEQLQNMLIDSLDKFLPMKTVKFTNDDEPWVTKEIKDIDKKRKKEFSKHYKSAKWKKLDFIYKSKLEAAKESYYTNIVEDLKESNIGQWYSKIKRMSGNKCNSEENFDIEELRNMNDLDQAEAIADFYARISAEYSPIEDDSIEKELYQTDQPVPYFEEYEVYLRIKKMSSKKSTVRGDIPMKIIKEFSVELSTPLAYIFNTSMQRGQYPHLWKFQTITPAPKIYPPEKIKHLRPISGLLNFAKIYESFLAEFMVADMKPRKDPAQYGNEKSTSIQHYLVKMIHAILTAVDRNSKSEANAVIVQLVDWNSAFDRQCHVLGVQSFLENGVRKSIIPLLISYFQNRKMAVKWKGQFSKPRSLPGSGAQGGALGQLEYLSQTNHNVDFMDDDMKYKFIDDLSLLEIINLVLSGVASYNFKQHVASDIALHGQYLPNENVQSQSYLRKIEDWTEEKKMKINEEKCKYMVVNFTKKYQFSTRLSVGKSQLEEVSECKLLGLTLTNDLSFDKNTQNLIKNAFTRMIMLQKLVVFNIPLEDLLNIYQLYIRSVAEQSCVVWNSSLTLEQHMDIERIQKVALRIILHEQYENYENALKITGLETLRSRRKNLCLRFAQNCVKSEHNKRMFPVNTKVVNTRPHEKFVVTQARTERLAKSSIPYMQRLLNECKSV